ncbi:sensor histidine kinase [Dactylosporangium sp. CA-052675]|uniref:sensor histidine kinase n=1 Tax=Dactylosporangium sp. CA-052675 TaxID=3239927 RepID=UPI003D8D4E02
MLVAVVLVAAVVVVDSSGLLSPWWSVLVDDVAQLLAAVAATVACWLAAARQPGIQRWWRIWMGAGTCGWALGQLVWCWYFLFRGDQLPSPSLADAGYLTLPVFAFAALVTIAIGPSAQRLPRHLAGQALTAIDGLVIVGALFVLSWITVLGAAVHSGGAGRVAYALAIAYPVTELLLTVQVLLLLGASSAAGRVQLALLGSGLFCLVLSDSGFAYQVSVHAGGLPSIAGIGYIAGFVLIAFAAWTDPAPRSGWATRGEGGWGRLLLPYYPVAAMAVALVVQRVQGIESDDVTVIVASAVVTLLVVRQAITLVQSADLVASRTRLLLTNDDARRELERNLHDGVQQRLIALALDIRRAESDVPPELTRLRAELDAVVAALNSTVDEVREISRGVHPSILTQGGLRLGLRALARRSAVAVELDVQMEGRLPEPVEVAAYYVMAEALTNAAKHAEATVVSAGAVVRGGVLHLSVRDNGVGGADPRSGTGLTGLSDRVEALGGTLTVDSAPGRGTCLHAEFPLDRP